MVKNRVKFVCLVAVLSLVFGSMTVLATTSKEIDGTDLFEVRTAQANGEETGVSVTNHVGKDTSAKELGLPADNPDEDSPGDPKTLDTAYIGCGTYHGYWLCAMKCPVDQPNTQIYCGPTSRAAGCTFMCSPGDGPGDPGSLDTLYIGCGTYHGYWLCAWKMPVDQPNTQIYCGPTSSGHCTFMC